MNMPARQLYEYYEDQKRPRWIASMAQSRKRLGARKSVPTSFCPYTMVKDLDRVRASDVNAVMDGAIQRSSRLAQTKAK